MVTRFRLTSNATAPAVSPAAQSYTHDQAVRRKLLLTDTSTLTTEAYDPDAADDLVAGDALHIQFVSNPLSAGAVFTSGDTLKFCIQGTETTASNNLGVSAFVSVVDEAGTTVRATLRTKAAGTSELPGVLNSRFHTTTLSGSYTLVAGDRIVVEFYVSGTPVAGGGINGHNASLRWGSGGAGGDLLENDTQTGTTLDPWIEFATTVTEQSGTLFQRSFAGSVTPAGTLIRKTKTTKSGSITATGALTKRTRKTLTGSSTPAGTLTTLKKLVVNLTGSITPAGSLIRRTRKTLTASVTPAGTLTSKTRKVLTGSITPTGTVTRLIRKTLTGSITAVGTLTKQALVIAVQAIGRIIGHQGDPTNTIPGGDPTHRI